jgi:hypothetical protein
MDYFLTGKRTASILERRIQLNVQRYASEFRLFLVPDEFVPSNVPRQGLIVWSDFSLSKNQTKLKNHLCDLCMLKRPQGAGERILYK